MICLLAVPFATTPARAQSNELPAMVRVHITNEPPVRLEGLEKGGESWVFVCNSPCDIEVPRLATYRIAGDGTSAPFALAGSSKDVGLTYTSKSTLGFASGIVLVSLSPLLGLGGVFALGGVPVYTEQDTRSPALGFVLVAGAVVAMTGGVLLISSNSGRDLTQTSASRDVGTLAIAKREPTWRDPGLAPAMPPHFTFPVIAF